MDHGRPRSVRRHRRLLRYLNHHGNEASPLAGPLAVSVRVAAVTRGNMPVIERTVGTVVSNAMVQVTAMVPGPIERAYFRRGSARQER